MPAPHVALVTGANKGLGFEISRQLAKAGLTVVMTARDPEKGEAAASELKKDGLPVEFFPLDVTRQDSVDAALAHVSKKHGRLDVLVNNAGIMKRDDIERPALEASPDTVNETFETNVTGALRATKAFVPLMKKNGYGRVVNMSSGLGQLHDMYGGFLAYRLSKTALNALTRATAFELKDANVLVNVMCPGWCRTDMGGANADRSPEEGARTAVWLATLPDGGPSGLFFRDEKEIPW